MKPLLIAAVLTSAAAQGQIEVYHKTASVEIGKTRQFSAYVPLSPSTVVWSVNGVAGGNATTGTVSATGLFTAPAIAPQPSTVSLRATSTAYPNFFGEATVTITRPTPWIWSASPSTFPAGAFNIGLSGSHFAPDVTATLNDVPLSVTYQSPTSIRVAGSQLTAGTYALRVTLPGPGQVTSQPLPVTVTAAPPPPSFTLSPTSVSLAPGATQGFTSSAPATWQASGGSVTAAGFYTAPATPGQYTVKATSSTDPSKTATATVTVTAAPVSTSRLAAARFLEQATFGPKQADIAKVETMGMAAWLDEQFALPENAIPDQTSTATLRAWALANYVNAPDQLRQRAAYSLGQILVVSLNKNIYPQEVLPWLRVVQKNAFGNYRTLLRDVTVSPSMGKFLDMANSVKPGNGSAANENYPRELMQLFSIGLWQMDTYGTVSNVPTYSQQTVQQMALALTGWTYPGSNATGLNWENFSGELEPRQAFHDTSTKSFLGCNLPANQTAQQNLEATIDCVFQHPNTPPFVSIRLIRSLVKSNPSPAYINRVAQTFINNGSNVRGDMKAVIRAILLDPEARQDTPGADSGRLREPILHFATLVRALNGSVSPSNQIAYVFDNMSQSILNPPSVFNWFSPLYRVPKNTLFGPEFQIYTATDATLRGNLFYQLLTSNGGDVTLDLSPFHAVAGNNAALVEEVNKILLHGRMPAGLKQSVTNAVTASYDNNQKVQTAVYLTLLSGQAAVQW